MPPQTRARKSPTKARRRPTTTRTASKPAAPAPEPMTDQSPTVSAEIPGFKRDLEDPIPNPMQGESPPPAPTATAPGAAAEDGFDELEDGGPIPASPTARRPRFKLPRAPFRIKFGTVDKATRDGVLELVGGALELIGRALQARTVPPATFGPNEVWIPDAQDQETIAGSIANMTARRIPTGLGADSDVADLLTLTAGTAGYAIKNGRAAAAYRRAYRSGAWSGAEGTDPNAAQDPAGAAAMNGAGQ